MGCEVYKIVAMILVVEDDIALCDLLRTHLESDGYTVIQAFSGPMALEAVEKHHPDLIILDWMLPGIDGLAVCRRLRRKYLTPIVMLTARTEEVDQILGLEVGADDYISKPFSIRQVQARIHAILRRVEFENQRLELSETLQSQQETITDTSPSLVCGPLLIRTMERSVWLNEQRIDFTPKEFDLLMLLASHPNWVFKREVLLQQIWGNDYEGFDRTIDNHIQHIRKKLGPVGEKLDTVWGVGYRFID